MSQNPVHLWFVLGDEVAGVARDPRLLELLSPEEHARAARFRNPPDAERFIAGRVLARSLLEAVGHHPASSWTLEIDKNGRPRLARASDGAGLDFNITHTAGLVACVLARNMTLGVDAEARTHMPDLMSIAARFFARTEVAALKAAPEDERVGVFFKIWTLKEAFVKALGGGLSIPLDSFAFDLNPSPPTCVVPETCAVDPESWTFRLWEPSESHTMALAARPGANEEVLVRQRRFERSP